jgi:hypothetical protein
MARRAQRPCSLSILSHARDDELAWLKALKRSQPDIRQLAILALGERGPDVAPDADAHLDWPVSIAELANAVRAALEPRQ